MSGMARWFQLQREELFAPIWSELHGGVLALDEAMRNEQFVLAEERLAGLYTLVDIHKLESWRVFVGMMEGSLALSGSGDLNRMLDVAMQTVLTAEGLRGDYVMSLRLGAYLMMMRCWLKIDEVGYASEILDLYDRLTEDGHLAEWSFWFDASAAWALWALGRQDEADVILTGMLAELPNLGNASEIIEGRGYIAYRMGRYEDAVLLYGQAAEHFLEDGHQHSRVRCELNQAISFFDAGLYDSSCKKLDDISSAANSLSNPHYRGLAACFRGRNALALEEYSYAITHLTEASKLYEGRGWLRDESQISIERLEAMRVIGDETGWKTLFNDASQMTMKLHSNDLSDRLAKL